MIFKKISITNIRKSGIYLYLKLIHVSLHCHQVAILIYVIVAFYDCEIHRVRFQHFLVGFEVI